MILMNQCMISLVAKIIVQCFKLGAVAKVPN